MELYATELMGSKAYDLQGNYVGRVREFFIEPADQPNRISHFLLTRGHFPPLVARHDQIASVAVGEIRLNVSERALQLYEPNESWLAVQKDLLDQQIIDIRGRKVVRVNDVDLVELRSNGNTELRLTQVDVGLPGAVRRLLHGVVSPSMIRRLQSGLPQSTIRWEFVNLVEPDPLRRVKLRITHEKLENLHPADLAAIMEDLSAAERQGIIASLDEQTAGAVLAELDERSIPARPPTSSKKWLRTPLPIFWPTSPSRLLTMFSKKCPDKRPGKFANSCSSIPALPGG
jgi:magnesium transporter